MQVKEHSPKSLRFPRRGGYLCCFTVCLLVASIAVICPPHLYGQTSHWYHLEREFAVVEADDLGSLHGIVDFAGQLTNIVKGYPIRTNSISSTEHEGVAWGYESPEDAWDGVLESYLSRTNEYPSRMFDDVGWVKGTHHARGSWGAYMWFMQNTIDFNSSTTLVYTSSAGAETMIGEVLVGTLGDYAPESHVIDVGPDSPLERETYPGSGTSTDARYQFDTTAYYRLGLTPRLVPDFNHDKQISGDDGALLATHGSFHFWINDDADDGNEADGDSDMPGQRGGLFGDANYDNSHVDGRCDLLDFFPVWLDLHDTLDLLPTTDGAEYKLRQANGALRAVYTDLTTSTAGDFLDTEGSTYGPAFDQNSFEASTFEITSSGVTLSTGFLDKIVADENRGILLMEGAGSTTSPLVLEIWKDATVICERELSLQISGVENMYRMINIRPSGGPSTSTGEPANNPDSINNGKSVFFLHGFNVNADQSRLWNAEIFKRLYQSGSRAKFWGMAWEGDVGLINALHYQKDVANALTVSANFSAQVGSISGTKIVLAHSLGNMVVSSAIQDHGLSVNNYFMLDAAVATECYQPAAFNDATTGNHMVHSAWFGYDTDTWCSKWFELFSSPDDRKKLTWKNRFPAVLSVGYNFYSSGDEIFETYPGTPSAFSGGLFHLERYAWHKQEVFKGRGGPGGTVWAGWGFAGHWEYDDALGDEVWIPEYTMAEANAATPDSLRSNSVFLQEPATMFSASITSQVVCDIIARGVPALSPAAGVNEMILPGWDNNYSMEDNRPNGWGRSGGTYGSDWRHSDLKNMAYYFTYDLFDEMVSEGGLQ